MTRSGVARNGVARNGVARNAGALMLSTAASALFGFLFWVVAARWFRPDAVGHAAALVSAMTLLAGVAQLNLISLYARFLPTAASRTRRMIVAGAAASVAMALLLTGGFVALGLGHGVLSASPAVVALFAASVAASGLHFILDGVLTPLGRASWVAAKNVLTSAAKLGLLALLAVLATTSSAAGTSEASTAEASAAGGMFLAWMLPVFAAVAAVGAAVLLRWAPAHERTSRPDPRPRRRGEVAAFVGAEYLNGILANAVAFLPPVLVTHALGATTGAYFYLPWIIGVALATLLWNVVTSFVVAASTDATAARRHLDHAIRLGLLVVVPAMSVLVLAAPLLLSVLGPEYAAHGALPLRLIGASLPFTGVVLLYAAFCVMDKRMWLLAAVQATGVAILLAGTSAGLPRLGAVAPALAYLAGQVVTGLALAPVVVRRYRCVGGTRGAVPAWADVAAVRGEA